MEGATPHELAEIVNGAGEDVLDGRAIVVEKFIEMIYNGDFNSTKLVGVGVTTALLKRNNIGVYSEDDFSELFIQIW